MCRISRCACAHAIAGGLLFGTNRSSRSNLREPLLELLNLLLKERVTRLAGCKSGSMLGYLCFELLGLLLLFLVLLLALALQAGTLLLDGALDLTLLCELVLELLSEHCDGTLFFGDDQCVTLCVSELLRELCLGGSCLLAAGFSSLERILCRVLLLCHGLGKLKFDGSAH